MKWIGLALAVAVPACYPVSNVCSEIPQIVASTDGGTATCIEAFDCPLQGEQAYCTTTGVPTLACVRCEQNICILDNPVPCK